jgi:hypothetical protein
MAAIGMVAPQHFLYFFPLPQGHGSFLPGFMVRIEGRRVHYGPPRTMSSIPYRRRITRLFTDAAPTLRNPDH